MFKVIISGTPTYNDDYKIEQWCNYYLQNKKQVQIFHTTEKGFDKRVEVYCKKYEYQSKQCVVDWRPKGFYDKRAKLRTHMQMILKADALIAFDFGGEEIKHLIRVAEERGLKVKVIQQN